MDTILPFSNAIPAVRWLLGTVESIIIASGAIATHGTPSSILALDLASVLLAFRILVM
jgi:hypothetical protein